MTGHKIGFKAAMRAALSSRRISRLDSEKEQIQKDQEKELEKHMAQIAWPDVGNEFLQAIDPEPAELPDYDFVNPSKSVRFPIFEHEWSRDEDQPPAYTPAIHAYQIVDMKMEWISPYETSPSRTWKTVLVELNSTQLNFYYLEDSITSAVMRLDRETRNDPNRYLGSETTHKPWLQKISQNEGKYMSTKRLWKSYSLQGARIGLAYDYSKRNNVLRMRCEAQQFLLQFDVIDVMFQWAADIKTCIELSLDIGIRRYPRWKIYRLRKRRLKENADNPMLQSFTSLKSTVGNQRAMPNDSLEGILNTGSYKSESTSSFRGLMRLNKVFKRVESSSVNSVEESTVESPPNSANEEIDLTSTSSLPAASNTPSTSLKSPPLRPADGLHSGLVDIYGVEESDGEYEAEDDDDYDYMGQRLLEEEVDDSTALCDTKWVPPVRNISRKRYIKYNLRLIKPLGYDHLWSGKLVFRATGNPEFKTNNAPIFMDYRKANSEDDIWNSSSMKNHYLKPNIVGPIGFLKVGPPLYDKVMRKQGPDLCL